jgi:hypothetical protein
MTKPLDNLAVNNVTDTEMNSAFKSWKQTGTLTSNQNIVVALYRRFKNISELTAGIPEYALVSNDARSEYYRFEDIIKSRYGANFLNN